MPAISQLNKRESYNVTYVRTSVRTDGRTVRPSGRTDGRSPVADAHCIAPCVIKPIFIPAEVAFQNTPYNTIIYENAPAAVSVFTAHACDADSGVCNGNEVSYFLMGDDSSAFQIDRGSGVLTTARDIGKALGESYKFYVIVTAGGLSGYSEVCTRGGCIGTPCI